MFNKYDAYKDSGIDWVGEIPEEWSIKPGLVAFSENKRSNKGMVRNTVLSLSYGKIIIKPEEKLVGLVPESFETYQLVEPSDIIIRCTDLQNDQTSLRTGLAKDAGIITSAYLNLNVKQGFDSKYLHYYLHALDTTKVLYKLGSGLRQNLSFLDFKRLPVLDIPLSEQKKISSFLDQKTSEIDQAIAIKEQQIALLNERKQIVIQKAVTQGLDPNVAMKDSGVEWIGKIPEHWECKPSRYAFRAVKRFKRDGSEIKFSVTQKWGVIPTDEMKENSTQAESFGGFQICLADDLVLNKYKAHLGVFWRAPSRGLITGNYTVFEPLKGINSKYFELLYHTPVYIDIFRTIVYGIVEGMMPLYNNDFYDMLSVVPPLHEQLEIVKFVEEEQEKFASIEHVYLMQIEKLKEYKTTLINDAVTGKIKVA